MKRINPKTNKPFKNGDKRDDGFTFRGFNIKNIRQTGYFEERWCSPSAWEKQKKQSNKANQIRKHLRGINFNPTIHKKRLNPKTKTYFKRGDKDYSGRVFLNYCNRVSSDGKYREEYWTDDDGLLKYFISRTLASIKRRAKKRNFKMNIDIDYLLSIYPKDSICPALKTKMEFGKNTLFNSPSIDRIYPEKGYTKGNVRFVSYLANAIMNDANADEILEVGKWLKKQNIVRHKKR
jgi:hypothetical protein